MTNLMMTSTEFKCIYCDRTFRKERTLLAHTCRLKTRNETKNEPISQHAFMAYQRFYLISMGTKNRTWEQFCDSPYYNSFIKFAAFVKNTNVVNPNLYLDWVIKHKIKLEQWNSDSVYEQYLIELLIKEDVEQSVSRSFLAMQAWADQHNLSFDQYFHHVSANRLATDIVKGSISPWLIYSTQMGQDAISRLNEEQIDYVIKYIEPNVWNQKINKDFDQLEFVKIACEQAGIK